MKKTGKIYRLFLMIAAFLFVCTLKNCDCSGGGKVNVNVGAEKTSGSATITVTDLTKMVSGAEKKFVTVSFSGTNLGGAEGTGETNFTTQKTIEVTSTAANPVPQVTRYNLKPGNWKIVVTIGSWSAECTKMVSANSGTSFIFNYNSKGCN